MLLPTPVDPKCYELALYFLGEFSSPDKVAELATDIQDAVEMYLDSAADEVSE